MLREKKIVSQHGILMEKLTLSRLNTEGVYVSTSSRHFCIFIKHYLRLQNKYFLFIPV